MTESPYTIENGWLVGVQRTPSPNFNARPKGTEISLLVVHNISLPAGCFGGGHVERLFCNCLDPATDASFVELCELRVSAHLLIDRLGALRQFVAFHQRAWHAGQSCFESRSDCNDFSIGIELEGVDDQPYTAEQYSRLLAVSRCLMDAYPAIAVERIVGHCDIAPQRKTDPGPAFDWAGFRAALNQEPRSGGLT